MAWSSSKTIHIWLVSTLLGIFNPTLAETGRKVFSRSQYVQFVTADCIVGYGGGGAKSQQQAMRHSPPKKTNHVWLVKTQMSISYPCLYKTGSNLK